MIHNYKATIKWTDNIKGQGTSNYSAYERAHEILVENKAVIHASSDPAFRGDPKKTQPRRTILSFNLKLSHVMLPAPLRIRTNISTIIHRQRERSNDRKQRRFRALYRSHIKPLCSYKRE